MRTAHTGKEEKVTTQNGKEKEFFFHGSKSLPISS